MKGISRSLEDKAFIFFFFFSLCAAGALRILSCQSLLRAMFFSQRYQFTYVRAPGLFFSHGVFESLELEKDPGVYFEVSLHTHLPGSWLLRGIGLGLGARSSPGEALPCGAHTPL